MTAGQGSCFNGSMRAHKESGAKGGAVKVKCETCLRMVRPCNARRHAGTCIPNVQKRLNKLEAAGWRGLIEDCQVNVQDLGSTEADDPAFWARVADMAEGCAESGEWSEPY